MDSDVVVQSSQFGVEMKILVSDKWIDGFLDYYRSPQEYRIQVLAWKNLEKLKGVYFVRPKKLRIIWNYLREIGLKEVIRKIKSRSKERYRNEKFVSCGLGRIVESADEVRFFVNQLVVFLAPCFPKCIERIVLPAELMWPMNWENLLDFKLPQSSVYFKPLNEDINPGGNRWWTPIAGWSSYSGISLSPDVFRDIQAKVKEIILQTNWQQAIQLHTDNNHEVSEIKMGRLPACSSKPKNAVLFGYGNYAKTIIIPNVTPYFDVGCIHEIDPTQIPLNNLDNDTDKRWDTSPNDRNEEDYNVWLIAGFHHTHTPLAVQALVRGKDAVVEKPIVTTQDQLTALLSAMEKSQGRLFCGFHKRYLPFNNLAVRDLGMKKGDPISYHCIVYEVPLPRLHWYRWPNSRSRLSSNGCHWIDHFLFLNNFCTVRSSNLAVSTDGTVNCSILLENDAFFTMILTDNGSERIGMQDYIELRSNRVTVKMINGSRYIAENSDRIIRKKKINKMKSYEVMYQVIGKKIVNGTEGDSLRSVRISCELILELEEEFENMIKQEDEDLKS